MKYLELLEGLEKQGKIDEGIVTAKALLKKKIKKSDQNRIEFILGTFQVAKSNADGLQTLEHVRQAFIKQHKKDLAALAMAEMACFYYRRGGHDELRKAEEILSEAEKLIQGRNASLARGRIMHYRAQIAQRRGELNEAMKLLNLSEKLFGSDRAELAKLFDSLGKIHELQGSERIAINYYKQSVKAKEETGDLFGLSITYGNLGSLYHKKEDYVNAMHCYQQAIGINKEIGNTYGLALNYGRLAQAYLSQNDLENAFQAVKKSLTVAKENNLQIIKAFSLLTMAEVYLQRKEYVKALKIILEKSEPEFEQLKIPEGLEAQRRLKARIYQEMGETKKAIDLLSSSEGISEQENPREWILTRWELIKLLMITGQKQAAYDLAQKVLQAAKRLGDSSVIAKCNHELELIKADIDKIPLQGGEKEHITVLFSDLKGYSTYSAKRDPQEVIETLNDYYVEMYKAISAYNGSVKDAMGDGMMVVFRGNAGGHHATRAVSCGLQMMENLKRFNYSRKHLDLEPFSMRIGIHTGEVVVGYMGSYENLFFTCIGSAVNLAARLEVYARPNHILISKEVSEMLGGHFRLVYLPSFIPKGFDQEVEINEVVEKRELVPFKLKFIGYGQSLSPKPGVIAVDVGNKCVPGVIDHHQHSLRKKHILENECATSLVYRYPHLILDHKGLSPIDQVTMVTHISPDFDAVCAAYLAQELLVDGVLPKGARMLSEYAKKVDSALLPATDKPYNTPYGAFCGIVSKSKKFCAANQLQADKEYAYIMNRGFYLMEFLCSRIQEGIDLFESHQNSGADLFGDAKKATFDKPFEQERFIIKKDYSFYKKDLKGAESFRISLPLKKRGSGKSNFKEVEAVYAEKPSSVIFPLWARQEGKVLVITNLDNRRFIVSIDPHSEVYLKGLGASLEKAETLKRKKMGQERKGRNRPGYHSSDPWYDGRSPIHSFTIVDSPREGTVLKKEEIMEIITHSELWT